MFQFLDSWCLYSIVEQISSTEDSLQCCLRRSQERRFRDFYCSSEDFEQEAYDCYLCKESS